MPDLSVLLERTAAVAQAEVDLVDVARRARRLRDNRRRAQVLAGAMAAVVVVVTVASLLRQGEPTSIEQVVTTPTPGPSQASGSPVPNVPRTTSTASATPTTGSEPTTGTTPGAVAPVEAAATGWVVFAGRLQGDDATPDAIYRMRADGMQLQRLAAGRSPVLSRDGSLVAYVHDGQVWVVALSGGNPRRVSSVASATADTPSWSPDGGLIAFVATPLPQDVTSPGSGIYVVGSDGSGQRALTNGTTTDTSPAWSPDGGRLAFVRNRSPYLIRPDGTDEQYVETRGAVMSGLEWSPDGTRLAFVGEDAGTGRAQQYVWTVDVTGRKLVKVGNTATPGSVVWSPDSTSLAYDDGGVVVAVPGGAATRLTPAERCPEDGNGDPCESVREWTSDGRLVVAYTHVTAGDPYAELLTMRVDGSGRDRVLALVGVGDVDWTEGRTS